jgi:hypothetical protein
MTPSIPEEEQQVGRFKKKQVTVEAIRWTGDNIEEILAFMAPHKPEYMAEFSDADDLLGLGGGVATKGDWVIKNADLTIFKPCSPDIFEETYEPA